MPTYDSNITITAKPSSPTYTVTAKPYTEPLSVTTEDGTDILYESGIVMVLQGSV